VTSIVTIVEIRAGRIGGNGWDRTRPKSAVTSTSAEEPSRTHLMRLGSGGSLPVMNLVIWPSLPVRDSARRRQYLIVTTNNRNPLLLLALDRSAGFGSSQARRIFSCVCPGACFFNRRVPSSSDTIIITARP
jgi:hypothetical protein